MFDLGWGELLVVGAVALVVLGPKELPNALRTITNLTKSARKLAGEFQSGINEIVREAELDDARKAAQSISKGSISKAIGNVVDPTGEMTSTVIGVEKDLKQTGRQISPVGPIPPAPPVAAPALSRSLPRNPRRRAKRPTSPRQRRGESRRGHGRGRRRKKMPLLEHWSSCASACCSRLSALPSRSSAAISSRSHVQLPGRTDAGDG